MPFVWGLKCLDVMVSLYDVSCEEWNFFLRSGATKGPLGPCSIVFFLKKNVFVQALWPSTLALFSLFLLSLPCMDIASPLQGFPQFLSCRCSFIVFIDKAKIWEKARNNEFVAPPPHKRLEWSILHWTSLLETAKSAKNYNSKTVTLYLTKAH